MRRPTVQDMMEPPVGRAGLRFRDRLQPALLDRLVDDAPHQRRESESDRVMSQQALRTAVLRDLRWLLNTVSPGVSEAGDAWLQVRRSVVNYGVAPLAGQRMSEIEWSDMEATLREAIVAFEPRILESSLEVRCIAEADELEHHNLLSMEIRGMLWCVPYPQGFLFRTEIDLESGHIALQDAGGW